MQARRLAYLASALAIASAGVSMFWTLGGTLLLDTVGGSIEKFARTRAPSALALGTATSLAKLGTALLALALVRPWGRRVPDRVLQGVNGFASAVLVVWGGANVLVGGLALTGAASSSGGLDERALYWHVFVWDLWFLVWGVALAVALSGFRRENPDDRRPTPNRPRCRASQSAQRRPPQLG
ncbi:MAG: DUF3995 domain-containing protein [Solirubrobacteraceae bacterium]